MRGKPMRFLRDLVNSEVFKMGVCATAFGLVTHSAMTSPLAQSAKDHQGIVRTRILGDGVAGVGLVLVGIGGVIAGMRRYEEGPE